MHLPLPSRHDGGNYFFDSGGIPGSRVGNWDILFNDSSVVDSAFVMAGLAFVSHSLRPYMLPWIVTEDFTIEGLS